nr:histone deacetylase 14 [Tanacetum cinerariifolium]
MNGNVIDAQRQGRMVHTNPIILHPKRFFNHTSIGEGRPDASPEHSIFAGPFQIGTMANEKVPAPTPTRSDDQILPEALEITPIDKAHQFVSPPSGDVLMDFVNQLGYPGEIHFMSRMATFLIDKANLSSATKKGKNTKPYVIPYCRFTKLIINYLGRCHNIHPRSRSPLNLAEDDLSLENLKFVPKDEIDEVFGMQIPKELITDNIKNAPYYNAYLEMVANHERIIAAVKEGGKKKTAPKAD